MIVLVVTAWLINYMTRFMLKKRGKEFGTYLILGMENKSVSKMFFYENIILGLISLAAGCIAGEFFYQGLLAAVGAFFGKEFAIDAHFSISAVLLTILYYALIQFMVIIKNNCWLKKLKICDLLNAAKVNENVKMTHAVRSTVIFVLALTATVFSIFKLSTTVTIIAIIVFRAPLKTRFE